MNIGVLNAWFFIEHRSHFAIHNCDLKHEEKKQPTFINDLARAHQTNPIYVSMGN